MLGGRGISSYQSAVSCVYIYMLPQATNTTATTTAKARTNCSEKRKNRLHSHCNAKYAPLDRFCGLYLFQPCNGYCCKERDPPRNKMNQMNLTSLKTDTDCFCQTASLLVLESGEKGFIFFFSV